MPQQSRSGGSPQLESVSPLDTLDATFVPLPEKLSMFQPRRDPKTGKELGGEELTPEARAIAALQAELCIRHQDVFKGMAGRWVVKGGKTSFDQPYTEERKFDPNVKSVFKVDAVNKKSAGRWVINSLELVEFVDEYMASSAITAYPLWLPDPSGSGALWAPLDKRVMQLPAAVKDQWVGPKATATADHPKLFEAMKSRGGFLPLSVLTASPASALMIDRARNRLVVFRETKAGDEVTVGRTDFPVPAEIDAFFKDAPKGKEFPLVEWKTTEGDAELVLTVQKAEREALFPGTTAKPHPYPVWVLRASASKAAALFAFTNPKRADGYPDLLDPDKLRAHPKFMAVALTERAAGGPLEPAQFAAHAAGWRGVFLQTRGKGDRFLVAIREDGKGATATAAKVPADLAALLEEAAGKAEIDLGDGNGGRILVGFKLADLKDVKQNVDLKARGPLWVLADDKAVQPVRVPGDVWDAEYDSLLRPGKLARQERLLAELLERATVDRPLALLPYGRKAGKDRFFHQPPPTDGEAGWLVRTSDDGRDVLAVRAPVELATAIDTHPAALVFQAFGTGTAAGLLAALDPTKLADWQKTTDAKRPLPLWVLDRKSGGAPFRATRPDGKTAFDPKPLLVAEAFDLAKVAARPARVALFRELARKGGTRPLGVATAGAPGGKEQITTWVLLDPAGETIWHAEESDRPAAPEPALDELACPEELKPYLADPEADLAAVRVRVRRGGAGSAAVLWLEPAAGNVDPRLRFAGTVTSAVKPYPVWAAVPDNKPGRISPAALFAWNRAGGADTAEKDGSVPRAYDPQKLTDNPTLTAELLAAVPTFGLWRAGPAATETGAKPARPDGKVGGGVLYSSITKPNVGRRLLIENSEAADVADTTWRQFTVGAEVELDAFLGKLASPEHSLAAAFGDALRRLPRTDTLWWAGELPRGGEKGDGAGYVVGPAAPPSAWAGGHRVRVAYTRARAKPAFLAATAADLLAKSRQEATAVPAPLRKLIGEKPAPADELAYLRSPARATVQLAGTWGPAAADSDGWGFDPKNQFAEDSP
ncbi:MAG: hypothetical protein K2X82_11800 [Gemmataceae bacterium]|nr:hypothetical protein [Gemmataceae bacterium]